MMKRYVTLFLCIIIMVTNCTFIVSFRYLGGYTMMSTINNNNIITGIFNVTIMG